MIYKPFDIVITPFPFVDNLKEIKYRPALIVSSEEYNKNTNCYILQMITSAKHSKMWNDYKIIDYKNTNLQNECILRQKFFTIQKDTLQNKIGSLNEIDKENIVKINYFSFNV